MNDQEKAALRARFYFSVKKYDPDAEFELFQKPGADFPVFRKWRSPTKKPEPTPAMLKDLDVTDVKDAEMKSKAARTPTV